MGEDAPEARLGVAVLLKVELCDFSVFSVISEFPCLGMAKIYQRHSTKARMTRSAIMEHYGLIVVRGVIIGTKM